MRWVNYQLSKSNCTRRITNFTKDVMVRTTTIVAAAHVVRLILCLPSLHCLLQDSECYSVLIYVLDSSKCDLAAEPDPLARAAHVIQNARQLGCAPFIRPQDIVSGNKKLNIGFVAQLFNCCPNLVVSEEVISTYDFAAIEIDDAGDSREERTFRMWINSLNLDGLYVNNLFADLEDGVGILKLVEAIQPGLVDWKR